MQIQKDKSLERPFGFLPVYEPGLAEVVEGARGRNLFFSDIKGKLKSGEDLYGGEYP